jgi:hypothetical protein
MSDLDGNDVARRLLPAAVMKKIRSASPSAQKSHHAHTRRYREMSDEDLLDYPCLSRNWRRCGK